MDQIYTLPLGAEIQRFEPDPELLAIAKEVQRQNGLIIGQNAHLLEFLSSKLAYITRDIDPNDLSEDLDHVDYNTRT